MQPPASPAQSQAGARPQQLPSSQHSLSHIKTGPGADTIPERGRPGPIHFFFSPKPRRCESETSLFYPFPVKKWFQQREAAEPLRTQGLSVCPSSCPAPQHLGVPEAGAFLVCDEAGIFPPGISAGWQLHPKLEQRNNPRAGGLLEAGGAERCWPPPQDWSVFPGRFSSALLGHCRSAQAAASGSGSTGGTSSVLGEDERAGGARVGGWEMIKARVCALRWLEELAPSLVPVVAAVPCPEHLSSRRGILLKFGLQEPSRGLQVPHQQQGARPAAQTRSSV